MISGSQVGVPTDSGLVIDAISTDRYELSLHRDTRFWESVSQRKARSKKRRSRKFISETQEQFSIGDDYGFNDDLNEIKFTPSPIKVPINPSLLSDEELIMQLAQAEDNESILPPKISSASSAAAADNSANVELQALEDLERELGLDDLNLFKSNTPTTNPIPSSNSTSSLHSSNTTAGSGTTTSATVASTTVNASSVTDDDNLDELEKYLQSLST